MKAAKFVKNSRSLSRASSAENKSDYFSIPEEQIKSLESVLTIVGGRVVFAAAEFERLGQPRVPVSPDWSPAKTYWGYARMDQHHAYARPQFLYTSTRLDETRSVCCG
jgi:hypothetical protein